MTIQTIALGLAAWTAISIPAGLLVAACIPPTPLHDPADQRGEGEKVRGFDQFHGSVE